MFENIYQSIDVCIKKCQIWIFVLQLHLWSVQYVAKVMIEKLLNNTYTGNIQEKDCF